MSLKLKDTNSLTYLGWPSGVAGVWPGPAKPGTAYPSAFSQEEELPPGLLDPANLKKKRRPANLCIDCPVCGAPAPDHLHFGGTNRLLCKSTRTPPVGAAVEFRTTVAFPRTKILSIDPCAAWSPFQLILVESSY